MRDRTSWTQVFCMEPICYSREPPPPRCLLLHLFVYLHLLILFCLCLHILINSIFLSLPGFAPLLFRDPELLASSYTPIPPFSPSSYSSGSLHLLLHFHITLILHRFCLNTPFFSPLLFFSPPSSIVLLHAAFTQYT